MTVVATITYNGALLTGRLQTSPWQAIMARFPEYGSPPTSPQLSSETLQPDNVDGARYRVGGAHWPIFQMLTITPAADFPSARVIARDMELIRGEPIIYRGTDVFQGVELELLFQVLDIRALANAGRPLGASVGAVGGINGPPGGGAQPTAGALASVDAMWTCQVYLP